MNFNPETWYWQLSDGRVWGTQAAAFVDASIAQAWATANGLTAIPASPVDESGANSEQGLREALKFYNLPLGELKGPEERAAAFEAAIDARLAEFAKLKKWTTFDRALNQRGAYRADAEIVQDAFDKTWAKAITLSPDVESGKLSIDDAVSQLPELKWPA
jgi:hypothetical protein